jgi:hypothetical protein
MERKNLKEEERWIRTKQGRVVAIIAGRFLLLLSRERREERWGSPITRGQGKRQSWWSAFDSVFFVGWLCFACAAEEQQARVNQGSV